MQEKLSPVTDFIYRDTSVKFRICLLTFRSPQFSDKDGLNPVKDLFKDHPSVVFQTLDWYEQSEYFHQAWERCFPQLSGETGGRIFLINQEGHIVGCYNASDQQDLVSIPEHIAFLLPVEKRKKILFEREREK